MSETSYDCFGTFESDNKVCAECDEAVECYENTVGANRHE